MTDIPWSFSGKGNSQILSLAELKMLLSVIWILGKKKKVILFLLFLHFSYRRWEFSLSSFILSYKIWVSGIQTANSWLLKYADELNPCGLYRCPYEADESE